MQYFFFVVSGILSGIFGGMGMGGGTLLIPILTIFLSFEQKLAQGINLFAFLIMSIISICIHYKNGFIRVQGIFPIIFAGTIFAILGSLLMGILPSEILKILFGIFLVFLSLIEFIKVFKK